MSDYEGIDFLEDLRRWIFEESHLVADYKQVRTYVEPDKLSDPTVTLYTGATERGDQTQDRALPAVQYFRAQLNVRDRSVQKALRLATNLYYWMFETIPPYPYETIWPMHPPVRLGPPDGNARWAVGFALRAQMIS
jgi:hypothetical protein